jgi:hypothetical protein
VKHGIQSVSGDETMNKLFRLVFLALLLISASVQSFSQLRKASEFVQDRIVTENTFFTLKDPNTAVFGWASEWTDFSANNYPDKCAIFRWHFKDGSIAYSRQGEYMGDAGKITEYHLAQQASNLEDVKHNKIQPLSLTNYPVKVELHIGEAGEQTGYKPELLVDTACLDAQSIEAGKTYYFSACPAAK